MNSKNLICPRCQGQMQFLENRGVYECSYCGYAEQVIESDQVKIERMRIQEEIRQSKKEEAKAFKKSKYAKLIIFLVVICVIVMMKSFSNGRILVGIIALLQVIAFTSAWLSGAGIIKEKFNGMRTVLAIVGFALIISYWLIPSDEEKMSNNYAEVELDNEIQIEDSKQETFLKNIAKSEAEQVSDVDTDTDTDIASDIADPIAGDESVDSDIDNSDEHSEEVTLIDGMRPEFKEAMDSYEAFFDEYVAFMQKYTEDTSNALSMLGDYTKFMTQYSETMTKMDNLGEEDLNDAELKYYIEVTGRINQKLLSVIQ